MKSPLIFLLVFAFVFTAKAQKYKFGKVSKAELSEKSCPVDPDAHACILYKERISHFEYRKNTGFVIKDIYFFRMKIYDKEGIDVATQSIPFYVTPLHSEEVMELKGVTYNLQNGKTTKTKLNKKNIFIEKTSNNWKKYKFTMPNVKPGSVIEFKFVKYSPFITDFDKVTLQYDIPVKKENIIIKIPEFLYYRAHKKGFIPVNIVESESERDLFNSINTKKYVPLSERDISMSRENMSGHYSESVKERVYEIELSNVPALKDEPYSGNMDNYRSSVLFELVYVEKSESERKNYAFTWEDVVREAYLNSQFGNQLKKRKYIEDLMAKYAAMPNNTEKLARIFELAKRKIKWNHKYDYLVEKSVVKAFNKGTGNVAEVNINLINMLNAGGFEAYPVLTSTVKHGIPLYATRTGFNYVIAAVYLNNKLYLLDATDPMSTPNVLPERVLNFSGILIKKDGTSEFIDLYPREYSSNITQINLKIDEDELTGTSISKLDNYFAYKLREKLSGKSKEEIEKWLNNENEELEIKNFRISNIDKPYKKISEAIQFSTDAYMEEISGQLFINPLLNKTIKNNPFKSKERKFPVFFNYPFIKSVVSSIQIPENYEVVKLPEAVEYNFGNKDGTFEYKAEQNGNKIIITSNYIINTPIINSSYYKELKDFIDKVINKQKEKIVLKKK